MATSIPRDDTRVHAIYSYSMNTSSPTWSNTRAAAQISIQIFNDFADRHEMANQLLADHIGFKCASSEEFIAMRALLENASVYTYQSIISARRIAICKLREPLLTACGPVQFVELSDQKPDLSQTSGFDHIEVYPADHDVQRAVTLLQSRGVEIAQSHRPHHSTFDTRLSPTFTLRIEHEPLIDKIRSTEML